MNLSDYETHYFTFCLADGETQKDINKVEKRIGLLGGKYFSCRISPVTGECKSEYRSQKTDDSKIFLYLSSLYKCRIFK